MELCSEAACRLRLEDVYEKSSRWFGIVVTGYVD
jgi:hypothetical protein